MDNNVQISFHCKYYVQIIFFYILQYGGKIHQWLGFIYYY